MIRAVFEDLQVRAKLLAMSQVARERVYRRVLRRNAKPVVTQLLQAWKGAKRRQGEITGDIAWAQESRLKFKRRGKQAGLAILEIGTNYKHGGGAKLWHILERGHRHYSKNATYRTMGTEANRIKRERKDFISATIKSDATPGRSRRESFRAAVTAWKTQQADKEATLTTAYNARKTRRDEARQGKGGKMIPGRFISRPIAQRWAPVLANKVRADLIAEVMKAARKGGSGVRRKAKPVGAVAAAAGAAVAVRRGPARDPLTGKFLRGAA